MEYGLRLHYFPARARAEAIRMLLKHAKIPFENVIVRGPEFAKIKPTLPGGQLPVLEVKGCLYPESGSQLRFVGQLSGTTPTDPIQFLVADAAYEIARGMSTIDAITNRFEGDVLLEQHKKFFEQLPSKLKSLSSLLGEHDYYGGRAPCFADFGVWHYLDNTETIRPGSVDAENLKTWMTRVASLEAVAEYLKERPEISEERRSIIDVLKR